MPIIWTLVARTGPVLILDDSVTVEGGLFMPFGVWFAPNGAVCNADAARGKGEPDRCSVTRGRGGVQPEGLKKFSAPMYIGLSVPFFSLLR